MSRLLSERVKKTPSTQVSEERYNFLKLSETEPDLGVPATSGFVLTSSATGERAWVSALSAIEAPGVDGQVIYNNNGSIEGATALVYDDTNGRIGIGTATPNAKLDVSGDIELNANVRLNSQLHSIGSTLPLTIASFDYNVYGGGKFVIQAYNTVTGERHITEVLVTRADGSDPVATEYGVLYTGTAPLATYQVDLNGGNLRLLALGSNTNLIEYRVYQTLFLA